MKEKTKYVCEICNSAYDSAEDAEKCEPCSSLVASLPESITVNGEKMTPFVTIGPTGWVRLYGRSEGKDVFVRGLGGSEWARVARNVLTQIAENK